MLELSTCKLSTDDQSKVAVIIRYPHLPILYLNRSKIVYFLSNHYLNLFLLLKLKQRSYSLLYT